MLGRARGPQTEAIVMLGREDHAAEAGTLGRARPLARVELVRIEDPRAFAAVAPLLPGEGIHGEMDEHRQLFALPCELRWRRMRTRCSTACRTGGRLGLRRAHGCN